MRVEASIDCGATYAVIYDKTNLDLSTVSGYITSNWTPNSASDWRNEQIDLSAFLGQNVMFKFVNINGYGNSTFVDNINVTGLLSVSENQLNENLTVFPNPATNEVNVVFSNITFDNVDLSIVNSLGQLLKKIDRSTTNGANRLTLDVSNYASGLYFVNITVDGISITKKLLIK